ncbi:MAG: hypothetical protein Q7R79_01910 [bacterium]|nr:hypothetical protein [bacterium]
MWIENINVIANILIGTTAVVSLWFSIKALRKSEWDSAMNTAPSLVLRPKSIFVCAKQKEEYAGCVVIETGEVISAASNPFEVAFQIEFQCFNAGRGVAFNISKPTSSGLPVSGREDNRIPLYQTLNDEPFRVTISEFKKLKDWWDIANKEIPVRVDIFYTNDQNNIYCRSTWQANVKPFELEGENLKVRDIRLLDRNGKIEYSAIPFKAFNNSATRKCVEPPLLPINQVYSWSHRGCWWQILRVVLILFFIFGSSLFIVKTLTPSDYTIHFKRECDGVKCEKVRVIDSERSANIENEISALSSSLERVDFFARFTFLRFDFQTTNQTKFNFEVTQPKYEKGVDVAMQCNLNGREYVFSPNSGIIFQEKSSIGNIVKNLDKIQNILINCNPATQSVSLKPLGRFEVAPNAQIKFIFDEEQYHLRFRPDRLNYPLTVFQMLILVGIFLGGYYEIMRFVRNGLKLK